MKNKRTFKAIVSMITIIAIMISFLAIYVPTSVAKSSVKSKSVSLNINSVTISVGDIVVLNAKMKPTNSTDSLSWSSSNKSVASVSKTGVVTGKKEGTAKITVKTSSKKSAVCTVKIKAYLTQKEALTLIQSNILSEETIESLIAKNTLSKNDIINLIQENTLSGDTINNLIAAGAVSEEQIVELIQKNTLSEQTVKALIKNNTLSEEAVKELIRNNSLSEDRVIELINERMITLEQIKQLINEKSDDFKDGDEVLRWDKQALPYEDGSVSINDISIKKYHCDEWNNTPQKLKLVLSVKGSVSKSVANSLENYSCAELRLVYYSKEGIIEKGERYYNIYFDSNNINRYLNKPYDNVELKKCEIKPNGEFEVIYEQYNINTDYNYYYIHSIELWPYDF